MAQAAVADHEFDVDQQAPEPEKRGPGRPPGAKNKDVETTPEDFREKLASADWEKDVAYVWRCDPFYDNTNGGRDPKYIAVETRPISEESLKNEYGSGSYKIQLNRGDKKIASVIWSIMDPAFPPHLPPGDWLDHPRNKKWVSWKPAVNKWWADKMREQAGPANQTSEGVPAYMVQFMNEVRNEMRRVEPSKKDDVMASIITVLPSLLQQSNAAQDPTKIIDAMSKVREMIAPAQAPPPKEDNTLVTFLLQQFTTLQQQHNALMMKMLDQKQEAAKTPDPLAQVDTMVKLVSAVSGIVQPAAPREPWQDVVSELGPKVVDLGQQFIMSRNQEAMAKLRAAEAARRTQQPAPSVQQPIQQPTQQPNPAPQEALNPEVMNPPMDTMQRSLLIHIAGLAKSALELQMPGDAFAEHICENFGPANYDRFIASVPKAELVDRFKQVPEAWALLAPFEAALPDFVNQFYAFAEEAPEPEQPPEPEPPKKAKAKGARK